MDLTLQTIMDATPVCIVVFDHDARVIYTNDLAKQLFGKSGDTLSGNRCGDFIACHHRLSDHRGCGNSEHCPACPFYKAIQAVLEGNTSPEIAWGEALVQRESDLPPICLKFKASGIVLDGHKAVVMAMDDITELKRTAAALQESEYHLQCDTQGKFKQTHCIFDDIADCRLVEASLQESVKKYRDIFEKAPVGIFQATSEGRFLSVNPEYARMAGYSSPSEMIEQVCDIAAQLYVRPAEWDRYKELLQRHGQVRHYEVELKHRDGSTFWASFNTKAQQNPDGTIVYSGLLVDIYDRVQAEQALRNAESLQRQMVANIGDVIVIIDREGINRYKSPNIEKLFGWRLEDVVGRNALENVHPEDKQSAEQFLGSLMHDPSATGSAQCRYQCKDGSYKWIEFKGINLVHDPVIQGILGNYHDITERIQQERKQTERERYLKTILDTTADGFWIIDPGGDFVDVNEAYCRMSGYARDELLAVGIGLIEAIETPDQTKERIQRIIANGHEIFETRHRRKDGTIFDVEMSVTYLSSRGGQFICFVRDIDDRKRAEDALRQSERELRASQQTAHIGSWRLDVATNQVSWTEELYNMYGFDPALPPPPYTEHMKLFTPESWERLSTCLANTRETGIAYELELETVRKDGSNGWMWVRGEAVRDSDGNIVGLWGVTQDITDRKRALEALRQSEEKFRLTFAASPDSVNINRLEDGLYVDINQGFTRLTGFTREDVIGKTSLEISIWHDPGDRQILVHGVRAKGFYENLEAQFRRKDGSLFNALMSATVININNEPHIISITRDITELRQAEKERKINLELLSRLNQNNGLPMLMEQVTELMRGWSGCDAVGIRLQEGEDYPYFETRGLPSEFVLHENRLCATDVNDELIRDSEGKPVLECMCGNVICGRFDPTLPFFTENGSFWTNSTTDLLSLSSEADRQARTRNRCHGEGYESVALIPLRHGEKNLGLLQFNDFRRDRFDVSKIVLLERLASSLSIGLVQCQTAEALAQSEEKYRLLIESQKDLVINFDLENRILFVSNSYCETFGKSEDELLGSVLLPLIHQEDKLHVPESLKKILEPPYETDYEERAFAVNGWRWFAWSAKAVLSADGQVKSIVSVGRDITDRKWAEQALRESEAKFRCLVEGAPGGLYVQDARSCFVYVNQAALKLFGARSQDQLLGKPILERFHPDFHDEIQQRIRILHEEKKGVPPRERICLRLDGTSVPVEASAVPVVFEGQNWSLVFLQDTTERKQMEVRLQQAQKMEAIGALAGGIAHDFNNILFPIIGMSEMLLDDFKTDSVRHENVMMIHNAALRAKDLVNQILSFSRQAAQQKLTMRLQPIIKEVIKLVRATIPSNIAIRQNIRSDCGAVLADPTNLHQVAMNLVTNAFHAVEQAGGSITVELRELQLTKDDAVQADLKPGAYVLLSVADTGHGILPDAMPKIFDPYFTTKPEGKGTGLGLSVCYGIVKDLGGEIKVYSEVGKGTVFNIYLPLLHYDDASGTAPAFAALPTGSERILVVDDEVPIVKLEKQMLERLGYRVSIRTSSHDALEAFRANPEAYDLVLTDMTMPNMTGENMAKKMMAIRADIPVIICTGFSEKMSENAARQAGVKGFLMKPLIRSKLAKTIRQVLDEAANAKKTLASGFLDSSTRG